MRWFCRLLLCLALLAMGAPAQAADGPVVSPQFRPEQVTAVAGGDLHLELVLSIAPTFHINSPSAGEAGLIPTKVELSGPAGISFAPPAYPQAHQVRVQFTRQPVEMYSGQVIIGLQGKVAPGLKPGVYQVEALISYQACDDMVCHMPASQELLFKVKVTAGE